MSGVTLLGPLAMSGLTLLGPLAMRPHLRQLRHLCGRLLRGLRLMGRLQLNRRHVARRRPITLQLADGVLVPRVPLAPVPHVPVHVHVLRAGHRCPGRLGLRWLRLVGGRGLLLPALLRPLRRLPLGCPLLLLPLVLRPLLLLLPLLLRLLLVLWLLPLLLWWLVVLPLLLWWLVVLPLLLWWLVVLPLLLLVLSPLLLLPGVLPATLGWLWGGLLRRPVLLLLSLLSVSSPVVVPPHGGTGFVSVVGVAGVIELLARRVVVPSASHRVSLSNLVVLARSRGITRLHLTSNFRLLSLHNTLTRLSPHLSAALAPTGAGAAHSHSRRPARQVEAEAEGAGTVSLGGGGGRRASAAGKRGGRGEGA